MKQLCPSYTPSRYILSISREINPLSERTNLSKPWIPVLQRHQRSGSLLSFGSDFSPPPSKSPFSPGSLQVLSIQGSPLVS
ncbi:hypothetical protein TNCV_131701 [Trichonephila clavipes]|nr:hypothetical protein TNCV_131701 [Trichonephila clavipes]